MASLPNGIPEVVASYLDEGVFVLFWRCLFWSLLWLGGWFGFMWGGCTSPIVRCDGPCLEFLDESGHTDSPDFEQIPELPQDAIAPRKPAVSLINHQQWQVVSPDQDPYISLKKPEHTCDLVLGKKIEDGVLEIDTTYCNYITLEQPSQTEIRAGEMVEFVFWHLELFATTPGEAFITLTISGQTVWEKKIPVPFKAEFYEHKWTPAQPIPPKSRILLHLHNHGANSWKIHSMTTGVPF